MKTILFVFGTRPEAIKCAPLILSLKEEKKFKIQVCSTSQHSEMLSPILNFFNIEPDFDIHVMTKDGQRLWSYKDLKVINEAG